MIFPLLINSLGSISSLLRVKFCILSCFIMPLCLLVEGDSELSSRPQSESSEFSSSCSVLNALGSKF
jgi:hypothetical protein